MKCLDLADLAKKVCPDQKRLKYEEHKHKFTKIAFDVFQLDDSPVESYWILEKDSNGAEYLVARYEEQMPSLVSQSSWQAIPDRDKQNVTLFYKETPICRFASKEYNFSPEDVYVFKRALLGKLVSDSEFIKKLIKAQPENKQETLKTKFPELF